LNLRCAYDKDGKQREYWSSSLLAYKICVLVNPQYIQNGRPYSCLLGGGWDR